MELFLVLVIIFSNIPYEVNIVLLCLSELFAWQMLASVLRIYAVSSANHPNGVQDSKAGHIEGRNKRISYTFKSKCVT